MKQSHLSVKGSCPSFLTLTVFFVYLVVEPNFSILVILLGEGAIVSSVTEELVCRIALGMMTISTCLSEPAISGRPLVSSMGNNHQGIQPR